MAGAAIAKAILGGIGGGMQGFASPFAQGGGISSSPDNKSNEMGKAIGELASGLSVSAGKKIEGGNDGAKASELKSSSLPEQLQNSDAMKSDYMKSFSNGFSDINLKEIYGDDIGDNIIEAFSRLNAIDFKYKPEVQEMYENKHAVDDKEHVGIIAQELEQNPYTSGTVSEDENGFKTVSIPHLSFENTAAIGELARRILSLESEVKNLKSRL